METKNVKNKSKSGPKYKSIRVQDVTQQKAEKILLAVNKKKYGRKVKLDDLVSFALDLVAQTDIETLQKSSFSNEDRKEQLRQKYIETRGQISKDQFTGFMLTAEFFSFLKEFETSTGAA